MKVGDCYQNTINNSTSEIVEIKDGIVTFACYEKTSGFLHTVEKPAIEITLRSQEENYLIKNYIEKGILIKKETK